MRKYELKSFPLLATIFAILALVFAVVAITTSLWSDLYVGGVVFLGLLEVTAAVLILAGLTTGKGLLLRVISIIITVIVLTTSFVLAIVKFEQRDVLLFPISLFMLIASVLELVYFLTIRNPRIQKMYLITSIVLATLIVAYAIAYIVMDIYNAMTYGEYFHTHYYFIILAFAVISILPLTIHNSMTVTEVEVVKEEPTEVQAEEEPQEEEQNPQQ